MARRAVDPQPHLTRTPARTPAAPRRPAASNWTRWIRKSGLALALVAAAIAVTGLWLVVRADEHLSPFVACILDAEPEDRAACYEFSSGTRAWSAPTPPPTPTPERATEWSYYVRTDSITGKRTSYAQTNTTNVRSSYEYYRGTRASVYARCSIGESNPLDVFVAFGESAHISGNIYDNVKVAYRFRGEAPVETHFSESTNNSAVFAWNNQEVGFARALIRNEQLSFRATAWHSGDTYTAVFALNGAEDPEHPVLRVLRDCNRI